MNRERMDGEQSALVRDGEILLVLAKKNLLHEKLESLGVGKILKKDNGEPYLEGEPYHISLTHKGDLAVAALSRSSVGVDIEDVTVPRNVERLSRLFDESEKPNDLYEFYRVWTAKEAMGKRQGTGISYDLLKQKTKDVRYVDYGDYLICIAGDGEISMEE